MEFGHGIYDDVASYVRESVHATGGVIVVVIDGARGSGCSMTLADGMPADLLLRISALLRAIATQIDITRTASQN